VPGSPPLNKTIMGEPADLSGRPPATAPPGWYLAQGGKRAGPFSLQQLRQLAASKRLQRTDMVLQEGGRSWVAAASVAGLFPPTPPSPPRPQPRGRFPWLLSLALVAVVGTVAAVAVGVWYYRRSATGKNDSPRSEEVAKENRDGNKDNANKPAVPVYNRLVASSALVVTEEGFGTGWVVDRSKRLLVTNDHVVGSATQVVVVFPMHDQGALVAERERYFDKGLRVPRGVKEGVTKATGKVIAWDIKHDLALIALDSLPEDATALPLAARSGAPGETVHSVGNPGASDALWVYTSGTIRQVYSKQFQHRISNKTVERNARVIETQAPINPGDSGGPVVNDAGELVGVVSSFRQDAQLLSICIDVGEVKAFLSATKDPLQGSWAIVKAEIKGKSQDSENGQVYTFAGDKFIITVKDARFELTYRVDAGKTPRCIDFYRPDTKDPFPAIYEVEDDKLKLCIADRGKQRPTGFKASERSEASYYELKRSR
jgi:uncharacterized protein (TIGR03067 family)